MHFGSYWLDTSEPFVSHSPDMDGGSCDVVVVGGGITGSAAALALTKKGARVIVCEAAKRVMNVSVNFHLNDIVGSTSV